MRKVFPHFEKEEKPTCDQDSFHIPKSVSIIGVKFGKPFHYVKKIENQNVIQGADLANHR